MVLKTDPMLNGTGTEIKKWKAFLIKEKNKVVSISTTGKE
jgi:hypothetical protein